MQVLASFVEISAQQGKKAGRYVTARKREKGACKIDPGVHAHVFGRPAGMWAFDRVMKIAKKSKDVWIGTRAEAAAHVRKVIGRI